MSNNSPYLNLLLKVRSKQEQQLRVRNFLPPQAAEPEIFLVDRYDQDGNLRLPDGNGGYAAYPGDSVEGTFAVRLMHRARRVLLLPTQSSLWRRRGREEEEGEKVSREAK